MWCDFTQLSVLSMFESQCIKYNDNIQHVVLSSSKHHTDKSFILSHRTNLGISIVNCYHTRASK